MAAESLIVVPAEGARWLVPELSRALPGIHVGPAGDEMPAPTARVLVFVGSSARRAEGPLGTVCRWRCGSPGFRGPVTAIGFVPEDGRLREAAGGLLATPGCQYLRLPAALPDLRALILAGAELPLAEWETARRTLSAKLVAVRVRRLRHRLDGQLAAALAALLEVEKLSYFQIPPREALASAVAVVTERTAAEVLAPLAAEIQTFCAESRGYGVEEAANVASRLASALAALADYAGRLRAAGPDGCSLLREAAPIAARLRAGLKELGALVALHKDKELGGA